MSRIRNRIAAGAIVWLAVAQPAGAHGTAGHAAPEPTDTALPAETGATRLDQTVDLDTAEAPVLRVELGATVMVTLHGTGDHALHLHGYDIEARGGNGEPAIFRFKAAHTGRFPVVAHVTDDLLGRRERAVVYIEVTAP